MSRFTVLLMAIALVTALLAGCGDDDDSSGESDPTATSPRATRVTETPDGGEEEETPTAEPGPDNKTPAPEESPGGTPAATAPGEAPTAPPPATEGTPATVPENESLWLASLGPDISFAVCSYNPATALADCGDRGLFAPNPPIAGQGPECNVLLAAGVPEGLQCRTAEPLQTITYQIQD